MKIMEFVNKTGSVDSIVTVKKYLPFAEKQLLIENVLDECKVDNYGYTQFDELKKYIVFTIAAIQAYTDLEFNADYDAAIKEYDLLCENHLLSDVIDLFSEEYSAVLSMLNMKAEYILKSNSIECTVAQFLHRLNDKLDGVLNNVSSDLSTFTEHIETEDIDKLVDLLKTLGN